MLKLQKISPFWLGRVFFISAVILFIGYEGFIFLFDISTFNDQTNQVFPWPVGILFFGVPAYFLGLIIGFIYNLLIKSNAKYEK